MVDAARNAHKHRSNEEQIVYIREKRVGTYTYIVILYIILVLKQRTHTASRRKKLYLLFMLFLFIYLFFFYRFVNVTHVCALQNTENVPRALL